MKSQASSQLNAFMRDERLKPAAFAKLISANRSQVYRLLSGERGPSNALAVRIEEVTLGRVRSADWTVALAARPRRRSAARPSSHV